MVLPLVYFHWFSGWELFLLVSLDEIYVLVFIFIYFFILFYFILFYFIVFYFSLPGLLRSCPHMMMVSQGTPLDPYR